MTPADETILSALPEDGSWIGLRELGGALGTTGRKLGPAVDRLERRGLLEVERPPGGPSTGQRRVRRDGSDIATWRERCAETRARLDDLITASERAAALLLGATDAARGNR